MQDALNVLGTELEVCGTDPMTGYFRDGCCNTDQHDRGSHTVCVRVTQDFLEYSRNKGNDLMTPVPEFDFPGLRAGDRWCLCASRWNEAFEAGVAPRVMLRATHEASLRIVKLEDLKKHAGDLS
jgi:uncharacterized protein (DUF2237 family)